MNMDKMPAHIRDLAIREIGCIVGHMRGLPWIACEKHHLLTTGLHGNGERRGERYTIGLNSWSHQGRQVLGWTAAKCREVLGPSYARQAHVFRDEIGTDEFLLGYQDRLIREWASHLVVRPW